MQYAQKTIKKFVQFSDIAIWHCVMYNVLNGWGKRQRKPQPPEPWKFHTLQPETLHSYLLASRQGWRPTEATMQAKKSQ